MTRPVPQVLTHNCPMRFARRLSMPPITTAPTLQSARLGSGGPSRRVTGWVLPMKCTIGPMPKEPTRTPREGHANWTMKGFSAAVLTLSPANDDAARPVWYDATDAGEVVCADCI